MNKQLLFKRNLEISREFSRYVLEHPKFADKIPHNALVVFLPRNDQTLRENNLKLALAHREPKESLVYVHYNGLQKKSPRMVRPKLEIVNTGAENGNK